MKVFLYIFSVIVIGSYYLAVWLGLVEILPAGSSGGLGALFGILGAIVFCCLAGWKKEIFARALVIFWAIVTTINFFLYVWLRVFQIIAMPRSVDCSLALGTVFFFAALLSMVGWDQAVDY